ncbi:hypothetical protein [Kitasatospora sp. McL0602]
MSARSGTLKWTFHDDSDPGSYNDWHLSTDGSVAFARLGIRTYALPTG